MGASLREAPVRQAIHDHPGGSGEPVGFLGEYAVALVGEPVVAAGTPVDDLFTVGGDEPLAEQPIDHRVQRAGSECHPLIGQLSHPLDHGIPVERATE